MTQWRAQEPARFRVPDPYDSGIVTCYHILPVGAEDRGINFRMMLERRTERPARGPTRRIRLELNDGTTFNHSNAQGRCWLK